MRNRLRTSWGKMVGNIRVALPLPTINLPANAKAVGMYAVLSAVISHLYQPFSTAQKQHFHLLDGQFYPSSTGPIITTTKYINLLLVNNAGV